MGWVAGVDGCPGGWVAVSQDLETGEVSAAVHDRIDSLFESATPPAVVAIDIPIGLADAGPRECDRLARKVLGWPRSSSVFPAPVRPALEATSRAQASDITRAVDGRGVGVQAWNIFKKVREIDDFLAKSGTSRQRLVEVHPELSFMALNGNESLQASKHHVQGINQRRALLAGAFGRDAVLSTAKQLAGTRAGENDLLDALAALWSARRILEGKQTCLPSPPPRDTTGLPMRICY